MTTFNPDGPHSPELTREAASEIAELVRFMNYATRGDCDGLLFPSDLGRVVANLAIAAGRLPQFLGQCAPWIEARARYGALYDDRGDDVLLAATKAAGHLGHASHFAAQLEAALNAARDEIAHLGVREGTDG